MRTLQAGFGIVLATCAAFLGGNEGTCLHACADRAPAPAVAEAAEAAVPIPASTATSASDTMYVQAPLAAAAAGSPAATAAPAAAAGNESEVSVQVLPTAAPEPPVAEAPAPAAGPAGQEQGSADDEGPGEATVTIIDPYAPPAGGGMLPPDVAAGGNSPAPPPDGADRPVIEIVDPQADANGQLILGPDGQPLAGQPGGEGQPGAGPLPAAPGQGPSGPAPLVVVEGPQPVTIDSPSGEMAAQPFVYYPPSAWASTSYVSYGPAYTACQAYPGQLWPPEPYYYGDVYASEWATDFYLGLPYYGCGYYYGPLFRPCWRAYAGLGYGSYYGHRQIVHQTFGHPWDSYGSRAFAGSGRGTVVGRIVGAQNARVAKYAPAAAGLASMTVTPARPGAPSRMPSAAPLAAQQTSSVAATRRPATPIVKQAEASEPSEAAGRMIDTRKVAPRATAVAAAAQASAGLAQAGARPSSLSAGSAADAAALDSIAQKRQAYREMVRTQAAPGTPAAPAGSVPSRAVTSAKPFLAAPANFGQPGTADPRADLYRRVAEAQAKAKASASPAAPSTPGAPRPVERTTLGPGMGRYGTSGAEPAPAAPSPAAQPAIRKTMNSGAINYVPGRNAAPIAPSAEDRQGSPVRTIVRPTAQAPVFDESRQPVAVRVEPRSIPRDDSASGMSRASPSGPTRAVMPSDWPSDYRPSRSFSVSGSTNSDQRSAGSSSGSSGGRR